MGRIFGTDGARGVANTEISCTLAMDIGRAAAMVVARDHHKRKPVFLVGHDTRISHDMLESAIAAGLCSVGADVVTLGTVPTPAVAYLVANSDADAAIMLSASHNPYEFNGIKIFGAEGFKLTDEEEMEIEEIVLDHILPYDLKWNDELGVIRSGETLVEQYIDHIVSTVEGDLSGIRVAADCANGSASATAAKIFAKLGADVTILNDKPNGVNINDNCGSTHIDVLGKYVRENGFDLGVAFDGDADRCLAVDESGELVDGDKLIAIFSSQMKREGKLANDTAVVTVMSNMGFFKFAEQAGIHVEKTKRGRPLCAAEHAGARPLHRRRAVGTHHFPRVYDHRRRAVDRGAAAESDQKERQKALGAGAADAGLSAGHPQRPRRQGDEADGQVG